MKVCQTINLLDENFNVLTLRPGDTVPEWAESRITNPAVIAPDETENTGSESGTPVDPNGSGGSGEPDPVKPEVVDYKKLDKEALGNLLAERELDTSKANKPVLIERLIAADKAAEDAVTENEDEDIDVWTMSVEELKAHAEKHNIDVGDAETTNELAAIIEQAGTE